ncbi:MAG TPA: MlaD family protein [Solirubrobacteraceae bacterium]|jgi:phospholipid/cholesterol/gamma-HCH transport system substrate-binding protein|nr:MlaD family protein [Solirubrobacteraceae bacterium]
MVNTDRLKLEIARSRTAFIMYLLVLALGLFAIEQVLSRVVFQRPWDSYYDVNATFQDVKGVVTGKDQVRIAGIPVGVISQSRLSNGQAVLTLAIQSKYKPLYRNATVELRAQTPLEDMYAQVTPGTPSAGVIPNNGTITVQQTITPVDISRVLDTFNQNTRSMLTVLLSELSKGLGGTGGQQLEQSFVALAPFLHDADKVTRAMADRKAELAQVITNFGTLAHAVADTDKQLSGFINTGDQTLGELADEDGPLSSTIANLPPTLSALKSSLGVLQAAEGQLDPALTDLHSVAAALPSGLKGLQNFAIEARPALRALQPTLSSLLPLATNLQPTAGSLRGAFTTLDPLAPGFNNITTQVADCSYVLHKFFAWTPSVTAYGTPYGAIPRADTTVGVDTVGGLAPDVNEAKYPSCPSGVINSP